MQKQKTSFLVGILLVLSFYTLGVYHVMAQSDNGLRTDITGQYSNPTYGIVNFEIPEGWHASEGMFGDKGISVAMHPGTSDELAQKLTTGQVNETIPIMDLVVLNKEERQVQNAPLSSLSTQCTELQSNSTATIDGKVFNVSTMKCTIGNPQSQQQEQLGIPDFSSTEIFKRYEHESPNSIYALQLTLSSEKSPQNVESNISDIARFAPIIERAIQTLRLNQ
jgi:hypothetical protein